MRPAIALTRAKAAITEEIAPMATRFAQGHPNAPRERYAVAA
jgi:hypothetical protein